MSVPILVHSVSEYSVHIYSGPPDSELDRRAEVQLFENETHIVTLKFRDPGQNIPKPDLTAIPTAYYPTSALAALIGLVDGLRNGRIVHATVDYTKGSVVVGATRWANAEE
jgi:hypothetical protein